MRLTAIKTLRYLAAACIILILTCQIIQAEVKSIPYPLHSGFHDNNQNSPKSVFQQDVVVEGAYWLRLYFDNCNLGQESELVIRAEHDGAIQNFKTKGLTDYKNATAYFNGNKVTIELIAAPGETDLFIKLIEVFAEIPGPEDQPVSTTLCDNDDRVSSGHSGIGRVVQNVPNDPGVGSAFIASNGALITAGHNVNIGYCVDLFEFNVPASLPGGQNPVIQHPDPADQYVIDFSDSLYHEDGNSPPYPAGDDWGVFRCQPNTQTGLLPHEVQYSNFRLSRDVDPAYVSVTGYGNDFIQPDAYTLQTDWGEFLGESVQGNSDVEIEFVADARHGNSGCPVTVYGTNVAIGIYTDGVCDPPIDGNRGTGFENDALENAINNFPGYNLIYVDKDHPSTPEDGTVMRPYDTVLEGATGSSTGDTLFIMPGLYDEQITLNQTVTLTAPMGTVTIGQ